MKTSATLVLTNEDIARIVVHCGADALMDQLLARLIAALRRASSDSENIPVRAGFHYERPTCGLVEWMPLHAPGQEVMLKVVGYHSANPEGMNLPTILSTVSAYDTASGHLSCLMDGVLLTALRTGAASAVASRYLAHPNSRVLGLIGCGAQAVTQLHALSRVFDLQQVLLHDTDPRALESFARRCAPLNLSLEMRPAPLEELVPQADILVSCTSIGVGEGPLFEDLPIQPHLHINAVGSDFPGKVELPRSLLENCLVVPDFREQALREGECQQLPPETLGPELAHVVQHPADFDEYRFRPTVFDSTGWALEDFVALQLLREYALELGLGRWLEIEQLDGDVKNPYDFLLSPGVPAASSPAPWQSLPEISGD